MAVRAGFKQTEAGVIPVDWMATSVGQLIAEGVIEKPMDGNHGNIHPKSADFVDFGIPFVMANNVKNGRVDLDTCAFISKKQADSLQKGFAKTGDVLLTHKATIGNTAVVPEISTDYVMLTPQVTYYRVKDGNRLNNQFLRHIFDGGHFQKVLKQLSGGGTRSYIGITAQHSLPLSLPPTKSEQVAIADILSDADLLLASLEKLIAKKRDIKQATMQQLLTGKTRLPGFNGKWLSKPLGEIGEFKNGINKDSADFGHGQPFVNLMDVFDVLEISSTKNLGLIKTSNQERETYNLKKGDVLFVRSSVKPSGVGLTTVVTSDLKDCVYSGFLIRYRTTDSLLLEFKKYCFTEKQFRNAIIAASTVSANTNINQENLKRINLKYPEDTTEQTAIATVLNSMEDELRLLAVKLEKLKLIKQGMMQELLTGRIRLL